MISYREYLIRELHEFLDSITVSDVLESIGGTILVLLALFIWSFV